MKRIKKVIIFLILGIAIGYGCLSGIILYTIFSGVVNIDGWKTSKDIGSSDADMVIRAAVAKFGLFANAKEEAVYFIKENGPGGDKFNGRNQYQLQGKINVPYNWWSITAYTDDSFLIPNSDKVYSFTSFNIDADENGIYTIDLAPVKPKDSKNWLPTKPGEKFNLVLRCYLPEPSFYENLEAAQLPLVKIVN